MKTQKSTHLKFLYLLVAGTLALTRFEAAGANTWTNAAGDLLWSTAANWTNSVGANAVPTLADDVVFNTLSGFTNTPGDVNNIVDTTAAARGLNYTPTNPCYHTTLIQPGITLNVNTNTTPDLASGMNTTSINPGDVGYATIKGSGGASLVLGNVSNPNPAPGTPIDFDVWYVSTVAGAQTCTLDMSGLDNFTFGGGLVRIGSYNGGNTSRGAGRGTLLLARTNFILAASPLGSVGSLLAGISVGVRHSTAAAVSAIANDVGEIQLGITNALRTDHFKIGCYANGAGTVRFQAGALAFNPSLSLRSSNGVSRVSLLGIGDCNEMTTDQNALATGTMDLTGGTVDALVNNLYVGRNMKGNTGASTSRRGSGNGTLTWTAGTIDATTLNVGSQAGNNAGSATGVVNVRTNASLIASTVTIGQDLGGGAGTGNGTLTIAYGGAVTVTNNLVDGTSGTSAINVTNGTLHLGAGVTVDSLKLDGGTLHFLPGNATDLSGTAPMTFAGNEATVDTDTNNVTFASAIGTGNAAGLTKTGSGRLTLSAAAGNTYTGNTTISNGTLRVSNTTGSATGSGAVTVATGATLGGTGIISGAVTVNSGGIFSPGASIGTLTITSNLVLSASSTNVFEVDSDTLAHDLVTGISNVTYGGTLVISTNGVGTAITNGASVQLFSAASYSGSFAAIVPTTPAPGFVWDTTALTTSGTLGIQQVAWAVNDTASRPAGFPLTILKSALLANDSGVGPLSVLATDATSTNGATITTNVNYVFYSPPLLNPDVTDRFTYTLSDGVSTSVGTVEVTIRSPSTNQSLNITGISTNGDGNYTISFAGVPTNIYLVQATTNLVTPLWVSIGTNVAGTNGLWSFTDLEATNYPSRFYRTARP